MDDGLSEKISGTDPFHFPPEITLLSTYHLTEEEPFELFIEAEGAHPLSYDVVNLPENATIDSATGRFSWTPLLGESLLSPHVIQFNVSDGTYDTYSNGTFFVDAAQPYIYEVTPYRVSNAENTEIIITGSAFSPIVSLMIDGTPVDSPELISETEIRCEVPVMPDSFGPVPVTITFTYNSATSLNALFLYSTDFDFQTPGPDIPAETFIESWMPVDYHAGVPDEIVLTDNESIWMADVETGYLPILHHTSSVTDLVVGQFEADPGEEFAFIDLYGTVWIDPGPENAGVVLVHNEASPATHLTTFDLEGDGDDELIVIDTSGDLWLYASLSSGGFSSPVITPGFSSDIDAVESLLIDLDFVIHLLVKNSQGLSLAPIFETGVAGALELIQESQGFELPTAEWPADSTRAELLSIKGQDVAAFTYDESTSSWKFSSLFNVANTLQGHSHLIDVDQDGINELYTVSDEWPVIALHQLQDTQYEMIQWLAPGELSPISPMTVNSSDTSSLLYTTTLSSTTLQGLQKHAVQPYLSGPMALYSGSGNGLFFGDITLDGLGDIVVLGALLDNTPVQLHFRGVQDGLYNPSPTVLPSNEHFIFETLIDLTGDFMPDVVGVTPDGLMTCFPSRGIGVYETPITADFGHGVEQFTAINRSYEQGQVILHLENGQTVWAAFDQQCVLEAQETLSEGGLQFWTEDIDLDGYEELLLLGSDQIFRTYTFVSHPELLRESVFPVSSVSALSTGDFNGDLINDLALLSGGELYIIYTFEDEDSALLEKVDTFISSAADKLTSADFNGDGIYELVATGGNEPITIYRFDGPGHMIRFPYWTLTTSSPMMGDIDNDSDLDLMILIDGLGPVIWTTVTY